MRIRPRLGLALAVGLAAVAGGAAGLFVAAQAGANDLPEAKVYLTPQCGCCGDWVEHLDSEGFDVDVREVDSGELNALKAEAGVSPELASCHTAFIGDYVVEGHVPAGDIKRLLAEEPGVAGLSVPGRPVGSPGMEMGDRQDPYDVVAFDADGGTAVFASYPQD